MGYDMYILGAPESPWDLNMTDEQRAKAIAWDKKWYYRLNIFGMQEMREYMDRVRILDWSNGKPYPGNEATEEEYEAYLNQQSEQTGMVLGKKFCSNDGWLITTAECNIIAGMLDLFVTKTTWNLDDEEEKDIRDWLKGWIDFNRRAAKHGGYRVR
jgi:hypothetical protein